jgi:protein-S-isoprenylcysteine O-methyltransferase Ste14
MASQLAAAGQKITSSNLAERRASPSSRDHPVGKPPRLRNNVAHGAARHNAAHFPEPARMRITPAPVLCAFWLLFALYWFVAAFGVKRTAKRQNSAERMLYIVFMAAGFFLLYQENPNWGPLNHRFVPDKLWVAWLGTALCAAGVLFAIWARRTIGKDWSAEVQIKEGHQLIRSGPYAHIRHPIYTGLLLATLGTALLVGEYRGLLGLGMFLAGFTRKARKEESFLAAEFGPAFEEHRRQTGFFLPRF